MTQKIYMYTLNQLHIVEKFLFLIIVDFNIFNCFRKKIHYLFPSPPKVFFTYVSKKFGPFLTSPLIKSTFIPQINWKKID